MTALPLAGVRVVEIGTMVAGPYASAVLADLGAEVVKIEPPNGDTLRRSVAFAGTEHWFTECNRGKKSIALDLTVARGRELLWDLVRIADAVVYNIRPDTVTKLGLSASQLRQANPQIVVVQVSAFGSTGPWGSRRGTAPTIDGASGVTFINGDDHTGPLKPPNLVGDLTAALFAALGVAAGLHGARRGSGDGGYLDVAMSDCVSHMLGEAILEALILGEPRQRRGNEHPFAAPHGCYPCTGENSWIALAVESDAEWEQFAAVVDEVWAARPEYATIAARRRNRNALDRDIARWTDRREAVELMTVLQRAGIASGAVLSPQGVSADPQLEARGYFGLVDMIGAPQPIPRFAGRPGLDRSERGRAPGISEHADQILGDLLQLSPDEIAALYASGTCQPPAGT